MTAVATCLSITRASAADGYRSLSEGIKVSYEEEASPKGPKAINVIKIVGGMSR